MPGAVELAFAITARQGIAVAAATDAVAVASGSSPSFKQGARTSAAVEGVICAERCCLTLSTAAAECALAF